MRILTASQLFADSDPPKDVGTGLGSVSMIEMGVTKKDWDLWWPSKIHGISRDNHCIWSVCKVENHPTQWAMASRLAKWPRLMAQMALWDDTGLASLQKMTWWLFNDSKTQSVIVALILVNKGMACHWFWECGKLNDKASPIRKDPKSTRRRGGFPIHRLQTYPSRLLSDVWLTLGSEQRVNIWRRCSHPRWRAWCFWASAAFCCSLV